MKLYFNGGSEGDGVPIEELENTRYRTLLTIHEYYNMSCDELTRAYFRAAEKEKVSGKTIKRNKTLAAKRNIGTMKERAQRKRKADADILECILRIMRMHKECHQLLPELVGLYGPKEKDLPAVPPKN